MKLRRISIQNFKGVKSSTIAPTKLTAFIGPNGAGKSSTEKAIIYGLSGAIPDDVITHGEDVMSVDVELDTGDTFLREYKQDATTGLFKTKIKLNGKNSTQKALDEHLQGITGMDCRAMRVVTSTEILSSLKAEEFGEFILGYLNEEFTFEKVISYCGPISNEAVAKLRSYTNSGEEYLPRTGSFSIADVEKVYYELADNRNKSAERPALKALVKTLQARAMYDGPIPTRGIDAIDADLDTIAKTEGAYQMSVVAMSNYQKTLAAIENQKSQIQSLKQQIASNTSVKPDEKKEAEIKASLKSVEESILRNERMAHTLRSSVSSSKEMLANLAKNECLCFEGLLCTTDKTCKKSELEEQIQDGQESIDLALKEIAKLKERKAQLESELSDFRDNQTLYGRKLLLEKQLATLESSPIQQPIKPEVVEQRDYTAEKTSLMREKDIVMRYNASLREQVELEKRQKELEVIEELVSIFKPKGIFKENVINYYLGVLENIMNSEAANLRNDFTVKLEYDAGVHILCEPKAGQGYIPYHSVSSGEQVFVLYLILTLLNSLTGLRILIMDDLNHLDKDAFTALIELINSPATQTNYDHVFVSSVNNTDVVDVLKTTGFNILNL